MINDNFFRFWFNFVFPNKSFIEEEEAGYVIKNKIKPYIDIFTSIIYEEVCRSYVRKGLLKGSKFNKVGRWWSGDTEIDIVGINEEENSILFGEVKWSTKKVGTDILVELKEKANKVEWGKKNRKEYYVLFGRKGFTEVLIELCSKEGVLLISGVP